jgi:biotin carboxylase
MDRIESLNEFWLQVDAELRHHFGVDGMTASDTRLKRSKWGLFQLFEAAKLPTIPTERATSPEVVKAFAKKHGYPLVLKPAVGVGSVDAFKVRSDAEVDQRFDPPRPDFIVQRFQPGKIVTYDGITDRDGKVIFALSHEYSDGVMETVSDHLDIAFWSMRKIPQKLEELGRKTVAVLGLRERWFHLEFFRTDEGEYVILEANLRPPGGFMTDMMNYSVESDVYRIYASVVAGKGGGDWVKPSRYHVCHVARHHDRKYKHSRDEVKAHLGSNLIWVRDLPPLFAQAMGDEMYLTRHEREEDMRKDIQWIQERA